MNRNANRPEADRYDADLMQKLIQRYESPDSRNRWDSPLIPVVNDEIPLQQIVAALFDRTPPPPNLSTQSQPVSASDYLSRLDVKSREVVNFILKAQDDGNHTSIIIPVLKSAISLQRPVNAIELNKLRRQFINYNKSHPAASDDQIIGNFVQFIQSNITDSN
jgi:protein KTI12